MNKGTIIYNGMDLLVTACEGECESCDRREACIELNTYLYDSGAKLCLICLVQIIKHAVMGKEFKPPARQT